MAMALQGCRKIFKKIINIRLFGKDGLGTWDNSIQLYLSRDYLVEGYGGVHGPLLCALWRNHVGKVALGGLEKEEEEKKRCKLFQI